MTDTHLPEYIRKARAGAEATYPLHVIEAGGIDHYQAGQSQALHDAILNADWGTVRQIATDPYTAGDDVDLAVGALAGACEPLTTGGHELEVTRDEQRKRGWHLAWRCPAKGCDARGDATTPSRDKAIELFALVREGHRRAEA